MIDNGEDPKSFLVLTFTNAAAFEMKERYKNLHPTDRVIPEFRTFHSFCYSVLCKNKKIRTQLGYTSYPEIISDYDEKKLWTEAEKLTECKFTDKQISGEEPVSKKEQFQLDCLKKIVQKLMTERNLITFDILCKNICDLFTNRDPLVQKYFDKYTNIFVDEFQDTDETQWEFVQSFENANIFLVADALQAIYGFRGADSTIVKNLSSDSDYKVIKLHENYRSTKEICDYINDVSLYADDAYRIEIHSSSKGPEVDLQSVARYFSNGKISDSVLSRMLKSVNNHKDEGTTAILLRTNREVKYVSSFLDDNDIDHVTGKTNTRVVNILKSLFDNNYLFHWLIVNLSDGEYSRYLRLQALKENDGGIYTFDDFQEDFKSSYWTMTLLNTVEEARKCLIEGEKKNRDPDDIVTDLKKIIKLRRKIGSPKSNDSVVIVNSFLMSLETKEEGSIYVGTIHSSKGLEYDSVIVMGANSYSFPMNYEDNKNLFYVGISRAKKNLTIISQG